MKKKHILFMFLLFVPSLVHLGLGYFEQSEFLDNISAAILLLAVTLCPLIAAFLFELKISIVFTLLTPTLITFFTALHFDGAERLVAAGFLVLLALSITTWTLGLITNYIFKKFGTKPFNQSLKGTK